jgi:PKD repeat protein
MKKFILLIIIVAGFIKYSTAQLHPNFSQHLGLNTNTKKNISLFVKGNVEKTKAIVKQLGGTFKFNAGDISSVMIPANQYDNFLKSDFYESIQRPYYYGKTMEDQANANNNVTSVHAGTTPLTQAYDGTGIIIGFLDSGIDFNHPDFKRPNGNTRIKYIWSQFDTAGSIHPAPFGYGKDWDSASINAGTCTHIPPNGFFGHGTLTAGVACGNSQQKSNYRGIAPNADLIFVAIDFNGVTGNSFESCVADGAAYCFAKAAALGKPCVINASLGTYNGSHDATDLATLAIENLVTAQSGRAFVNSAGNSGGKYMHLGYNIPSDSAYTFFNSFPIGGGKYVAYLELFSDYADWNNAYFAVGADKTSPTFVHRNRTPWLNVMSNFQMGSLTQFTKYDTIRNNLGQQLGVLESYCEKQNGHYFMYFGVYVDSITNYTWRFMTKGIGKFDIWSHPNYTGSSLMLASGLPTTLQLPDMINYMMPDTEKTIVGAWNCSNKIISVGNYLNRNNFQTWQGLTNNCDGHAVGNHYPSSSKGPTRNAQNKPDISASGEWTLAANDLYWINWAKTNNPSSISADTLHGPHKGTSAAAPCVSGAVALYFQKKPTANWSDVKAALTTCVATDNFTGSVLPNNIWGYGKLDAFKMLNCQGCTNPTMSNYNSMAQIDDGSCVYLGPIAFFKIPNGQFCSGDSIQLIDSSKNNPTTWQWQFDASANIQNSSLQNPKVSFSVGGNHIITLTASNTYGSRTFADTIFVTPTPNPDFLFIDNVCVGFNTIVSFNGSATSNAIYTWSFSGGNIVSGSGAGPYQINWSANGSKNITLNINDNNCVADSAKTLHVSAVPIAKFKYSQINTNITFTNQSSGATSFNWSFGDGNTSTNQHPIHSYSANGIYIVTLLVLNSNCFDSYKDTVIITNANGVQNTSLEKNEDFIISHNNELSQLVVNFISESNLKNIELYNMQGQLLYSKSNITSNSIIISTSNFSSGIYLANFKTSSGNIISKKWSLER